MRASEAKASRAGLVGQRDDHLSTARERLEQRPLGAGQVFEAVREDRLAVPGGEIVLQPLDRASALGVTVPEVEPLELSAVRRVERGELAVDILWIEQTGFELTEGAQE